MGKKLVIIESPNKILTIQKYLDDSFILKATYGHVRDLVKSSKPPRMLGFDQHTFEPQWAVINTKKKFARERTKKEIVAEINQVADSVEEIFLSTDPDREGEAICWHVYELMSPQNQQKCKRITFNEITKPAILQGLANPRTIDMDWVHAYFTRRIIDRKIGFNLSQLVRSKLAADSAGRVQSVALKIINDRAAEIAAFVPFSWWNLEVELANGIKLYLKEMPPNLMADLQPHLLPELKTGLVNFADVATAQCVLDRIPPILQVQAVAKPVAEHKTPPEAYKTATLQQDVINKLQVSSKQVDGITQRLYEGVQLGAEVLALITYPRTDRTDLSATFVAEAQRYIVATFGHQFYHGPHERKANPKTAVKIQGAHEAIRVVDVNLTPDQVKAHLPEREYLVYQLVWCRTVASLMAQAVYERVTYQIASGGFAFQWHTRKQVFAGFERLYAKDEVKTPPFVEAEQLPLCLHQQLPLVAKRIIEHEKQPPSHYNEASLIKTLEEDGIGRPSTYTTITNIVLNRGYVTKDGSKLLVSELGQTVIAHLEANFPEIINVNYTKQLEEALDKIANGELDWKQPFELFKQFDVQLANARVAIVKTPPELTGDACPQCHQALIYRVNKRQKSRFIGCSNFPKCRYIATLASPKIEQLERLCPQCQHHLVLRYNKKNQPFVGCSNFPKCKFIEKP